MLHPFPRMHPLVRHPFSGRGIAASGWTTRAVSSRTARKSSPPLLEKAPGTFSQTMYRGRTDRTGCPSRMPASRISFTILICSMNSPERSPASPALFPATERSWHGLPPITTSTGGASRPEIFVMSPRCIISLTPCSPATGSAFRSGGSGSGFSRCSCGTRGRGKRCPGACAAARAGRPRRISGGSAGAAPGAG